MGRTVRRRRVIRGWWHRRYLATENGEQTNDESTTTPRAQVPRRHREVVPVWFSEGQVSPCDGDLIPIGPVGLWRSQEVFLVGVLSCNQGPPRRGKSMVTLLNGETRKLDGRIDQADEQ